MALNYMTSIMISGFINATVTHLLYNFKCGYIGKER